MPILTQYWFRNQFFGGPFHGWNEPLAQRGFAPRPSISIAGIPPVSGTEASSAATLVWERADDEVVLDIPGSINGSPAALLAIDNLLGSSASRTSPVFTAGIPWGPRVPYYNENPGKHAPWAMIIRVYFSFHISTPSYCWDLDGTISYYLQFYLDRSGALHGYVDARGEEYRWKPADACRSRVQEQVAAGVDAGVQTVEGLIDLAIATNASGRFSQLYLLPGTGTRALGGFDENADTGVALALRPRPALASWPVDKPPEGRPPESWPFEKPSEGTE